MSTTKPHVCTAGSLHEVFRFVGHQFCVTAALDLIAQDETAAVAQTGEVDIAEMCKSIKLLQPHDGRTISLIAIDVNPVHAMTTDLTQPLLVCPLPLDSGGTAGNALIDGWHRVYKAHQEGITTLPAVLLTVEAALAIRLPQFI